MSIRTASLIEKENMKRRNSSSSDRLDAKKSEFILNIYSLFSLTVK